MPAAFVANPHRAGLPCPKSTVPSSLPRPGDPAWRRRGWRWRQASRRGAVPPSSNRVRSAGLRTITLDEKISGSLQAGPNPGCGWSHFGSNRGEFVPAQRVFEQTQIRVWFISDLRKPSRTVSDTFRCALSVARCLAKGDPRAMGDAAAAGGGESSTTLHPPPAHDACLGPVPLSHCFVPFVACLPHNLLGLRLPGACAAEMLCSHMRRHWKMSALRVAHP